MKYEVSLPKGRPSIRSSLPPYRVYVIDANNHGAAVAAFLPLFGKTKLKGSSEVGRRGGGSASSSWGSSEHQAFSRRRVRRTFSSPELDCSWDSGGFGSRRGVCSKKHTLQCLYLRVVSQRIGNDFFSCRKSVPGTLLVVQRGLCVGTAGFFEAYMKSLVFHQKATWYGLFSQECAY